MWISAFFTNKGNPTTGLSPSIRIRDISNDNLIVTDVSMDEVGDGFYKYNFIFFSTDDDYVIRCDAGTTLSGTDRYTFGSSGEYNDDFSLLDDTLSGINITTLAVDSRLPLIPAFVGEYDTTFSGIQEDLGNLETYMFRALGLMQENQYLDQTVYTDYQGIKLLTNGRLRIYSNAGSVGTDSDVIATYNIITTWNGDEMASYKVIKT